MPLTSRRGLSLAELLVTIVLFAMAGTVLLRSALRAGQGTRAVMEGAHLAASFDATLDFLEQDLADLGLDSTAHDLKQIAGDSLTWRATRGAGLACRLALTGVWVLEERWTGARLPQPGRDSLLVLVDGDSSGVRDARWVSLPILGVSQGSCGAEPALRLTTVLDSTLAARTDLPLLLPVRSFEVMQARFYLSQGEWWFGARSVSAGEGIQPLAGPFAPGGFRLSYADSAALATTNPAAVRAIEVLLAGRAGSGRDSAALHLAPRNLAP
jgi:hypothetical protein